MGKETPGIIMISVEEALEKVLSYVSVLDVEEKPILQCLGQVLNEDVYSAIDVPPRDNSAMDGYAVRAEDVVGATPSSPVFLDVIGEVKAGDIPKEEVGALSALRIMTGAPIPRGADSVVQFEDVYSAIDVPPRDNSAMDGYAVRAEDVVGATPSSPVFLDVIGEVKAGDIPKEEVGALSALRIMTGAPIPRGADSVVQFEDTDEALRRERPPFQIGILHQV
ncbi:unnamed protein product, partial [marine sediment metagenome]